MDMSNTPTKLRKKQAVMTTISITRKDRARLQAIADGRTLSLAVQMLLDNHKPKPPAPVPPSPT